MDEFFGDDPWGEEPDWAKSGAGDTTTNEDDEEAPVNLGAQHVLMVVDCHQDMFVPVNDDVCSADLALTLAQQLLQQRIRDTVTLKIGKRNGVGVLLFDTKPMESHSEQVEELSDDDDDDHDNDDNNEESPTRSVHVLIPLDPPGIRQVQTIRSCLKRERNLQKEFSQSRDADPPRIAPLQIALEEAVRIFRQAKCVREKASKPNEPLDARTIWILTNRDNPYPPLAQQLLQNVARDAKDAGIQILVWPLAHPETNEFVMEPLYGEVVSRDVFEGRRLKTQQEIEEGLEELQQYWKKIRRLYWGPLLFPRQPQPSEEDTPEIMVDWFRFVQLAKKPTKVQIDQRTKRETIKLKQYLDNNHEIFATFRLGDAVDRKKPKPGLNRIRQFASFGGERVPMCDEDLATMRLLANGGKTRPALTIFGFKPKNSIPWYHTMSPAYLIYPNDDVVKGSRDAFVELHAAMVRKNVLAVGEVLHRVNWSSHLVAVYPLQEDENAPGMMVVTLPFEDDIRTLEEDEAWNAWIEQSNASQASKEAPDQVPSVDLDGKLFDMPTDELVQAAIDLISRQRLSGMQLGEDFENAALTEFFNYLEAVALEIPVPDEPEEFDTRPDEAMILEAVGDQIEDFRRKLPQELELPKSSSSRKRTKELLPDDSGLDWKELYLSGEIGDVKVPQLKSYLRSVGGALSGTKALLVERVTDHIKQSLVVADSVKTGVKVEV